MGKFMRNEKKKKTFKSSVSFKMSGRLTEATQHDLTDGVCQMDEWKIRKRAFQSI